MCRLNLRKNKGPIPSLFIFIFTLIATLFLVVKPLQAYYIDPPVHQYIGYQAYLILPDSLLKNELANYIGEVRVYNDTNFDSGNSVLEGIEEEDCIFEALACLEGYNLPRPWRHFWDPDMGYNAGLNAYSLWTNQESAVARAQRFYNTAVQEYRTGNKLLAYWWLGRIAHLLEDMASPAHVHNDPHPHSATDPYWNMVVDDPEYYEYHTSWIYLLYNGERGRAWSQDGLNAYPLLPVDYRSISFNVTNTGSQNYNSLPVDRKTNLFKLFLNLAETTDNFESEDVNGDTDSIQENGSSNLIYWHASGMDNLDTLVARNGVGAAYNEVEIHADTLIPLAIRYVAGLYQLFWDETHGAIVFSSNRDGNYEIYVMNPDGTNQTRLTNNNDNDSSPTWSPDGTKILFQSDRDGNYEIYIMNADGTNQTRLTNNSASDTEPHMSPDGTKIAFRTNRDGINAGMTTPGVNEEVYVMNANGTNPVNLTNTNALSYLT